jgi:hypothetical protein
MMVVLIGRGKRDGRGRWGHFVGLQAEEEVDQPLITRTIKVSVSKQ